MWHTTTRTRPKYAGRANGGRIACSIPSDGSPLAPGTIHATCTAPGSTRGHGLKRASAMHDNAPTPQATDARHCLACLRPISSDWGQSAKSSPFSAVKRQCLCRGNATRAAPTNAAIALTRRNEPGNSRSNVCYFFWTFENTPHKSKAPTVARGGGRFLRVCGAIIGCNQGSCDSPSYFIMRTLEKLIKRFLSLPELSL